MCIRDRYPEGRWSSPDSVIAASSALLEPLSLYVNQLPQQYLGAGVVPVPPVQEESTLLEIATAPELFSIGAAHEPGSGTPPGGPDVVLTRQPDRVGLFFGNRVEQYFGVDLQNGQEEGIVVGLRPGDNTLRVWDRSGLIGHSDNVVYPEGRWSSPNSVIAASSALLEPLSLYVNQLPQQYLGAGVVPVPPVQEGATVLEIATAPELFSTLGFPLLDGE